MLKKITYNSRCSLVVTDPTTNLPVGSLSMGERTGSRIFYRLWSYVQELGSILLITISTGGIWFPDLTTE